MGGGRGRVGEVERPMWAAGGPAVETVSWSVGRAGGTGGASRAAAEGLGSRSRSRPGFGAGTGGAGIGDAVREEAPVPVGGCISFLLRFSNLASREDTGLCYRSRQLASCFRGLHRGGLLTRDEPSGPSFGGGSIAAVLDREQRQQQQRQTEAIRLRGPFTHTHQPSAGELLLAADVVHPEASPDLAFAACTALCRGRKCVLLKGWHVAGQSGQSEGRSVTGHCNGNLWCSAQAQSPVGIVCLF